MLVSGLEALVARNVVDKMNVNAVRPLQPTSSSAQNIAQPNVVVGVKSKAEVVDLREDYPL